MTWKAQQLLQIASKLYQHQKESYSRVEIVKKINEIKYLTAQKKVPRLSLRKEIIHLESQLQALFELEKKLVLQKKREALAAAHYKKQIAQLKRRLQATGDHDLRRKVDKLSHLLGENLAQSGSAQEAEEAQEYAGKLVAAPKTAKAAVTRSRKELLIAKIAELKICLEQGDLAVDVKKRLEVKLIELEQRINEPALIKHTLLFARPEIPPEAEEELSELPIPPPPRRT